MITKQEYTDLKKCRANIALELTVIKRILVYESFLQSLGLKPDLIKIKIRQKQLKQNLKWLDILLRDTKEQLRNRYESKRLEELFVKKLTKHIIPEEFKLEYEVSKTPKAED